MLAEAGAKVLLTDIDAEHGVRTATAISERGFPANFIRHDVGSEADWVAAIEYARGYFGDLDILVNNAGVALIQSIQDTTLDQWHRLCRVNIDGPFLGMKHALAAMRNRARQTSAGGSIINMSSAVGIVGIPGALCYTMTKAAVRHMTKSAALEFADGGYNIRVNSVHPGLIKTKMADDIYDTWAAAGAFGTHDRAEIEQIMVQQHPLGRHGRPEDVAKGVLFLASDDSSYMTGSELVIDGGYIAK
jgi:NAD(P)-dependent dehydrogenase (short-subunit alcohol dehydrogenase family)